MSLTPLSEIDAGIRRVVERWSPGAAISAIAPLTPDASLRRYFRIHFADPPKNGCRTAVAMWFDSVACPEAAGGPKVNSDEAYLELSRFLLAENVAVPELYLDARTDRLVIIEDLGDRQLASLLVGTVPHPGIDPEPLFFAAIDQLLAIQSIPPRPEFFPFARSFTASLYRREMSEFEEFLLFPKGPPAELKLLVGETMDALASELEALPRTLVHRDFHAWNLIVDPSGRIRVIDFQDALLATRPYDLVSLLNDRDMDSLLGRDRYCRCIEYFVTAGSFRRTILSEYDRVLLQRDFKVAGRFAKLEKTRGLVHYAAWIPGTLRRIGRTLERLGSESSSTRGFHLVLKKLEALFPELSAGAADPLRWEQL